MELGLRGVTTGKAKREVVDSVLGLLAQLKNWAWFARQCGRPKDSEQVHWIKEQFN